MKRLITLFMVCMAVFTAHAQSLVSDAQSLGMGGVALTSTNGSHAIFNNPAAPAFARSEIQVVGSYMSSKYENTYNASGYYNFDNRNVLLLGWGRFDDKSSDNTMSFDAGYARRLNEKWSIGAAMHVYRQHYSMDAHGLNDESLSLDFSLLYATPIGKNDKTTFRLGGKLRSQGIPLDSGYNIGLYSAAVGVAFDTFITDSHELTFGLDLDCLLATHLLETMQLSVGAEYNLMQLIQLRAGYHSSVDTSYISDYASMGIGVRFMHVRVDFAYLLATTGMVRQNSWVVSCGFDF